MNLQKTPPMITSILVIRFSLVLFIGTFTGAGCAGVPRSRTMPPPNSSTASTTTEINTALTAAVLRGAASPGDYSLGPEDLVQVTLFNVPESEMGPTPRRMEVRVSEAGMITLPLLGDVAAAGLTTSVLEQVLRARYDEYLHNPQVGVQVKEYRSQRVSVMGAVRSPGVFQLTGPKTLVDLLSMASGLDERAGNQVHIYRTGAEGRQTYVIDLLALATNPGLVNMPVQAGDVVNVPQSNMFFVDGAVSKPGSYPLNRPYTLTQALIVAGGVTATLADYSNVAIFRRSDSPEAERIAINLKDILAGQAADPHVEADDVVVVPMSTIKYLVQRFIGTIGLGGVPTMGIQ